MDHFQSAHYSTPIRRDSRHPDGNSNRKLVILSIVGYREALLHVHSSLSSLSLVRGLSLRFRSFLLSSDAIMPIVDDHHRHLLSSTMCDLFISLSPSWSKNVS